MGGSTMRSSTDAQQAREARPTTWPCLRTNYLEELMAQVHRLDNERAAVVRLFETPLLGGKNGNGRYYDWSTNRFDASALRRDMGPWSSGERIMAALALELWGYPLKRVRDRFSVLRCAATLDSGNLQACVEAIAIRGGWLDLGRRFVATTRS
jgi:hypothetical protein